MDYPEEIETISILLEFIEIGDRHRSINEDGVQSLMSSMQEIGIQTPITAREVPHPDGPDYGESWVLITGAHRLEAAKRLGWTRIDVRSLSSISEVDAELWEIDENLMRSELTPAQRAKHLVRRQELWELRQNASGTICSTRCGGNDSKGKGYKGFASDVSTSTGKSKQDVNRAISRGTKIAPDVLADVQGTEMDKGVELDALAKMEPDEQRNVVSLVKSGEAKSIRDASPVSPPREILNDNEIINKQVDAIIAAWNRAGPEAREQFIDCADRYGSQPIRNRM
jgi:ParB family chromosome partitioning protein